MYKDDIERQRFRFPQNISQFKRITSKHQLRQKFMKELQIRYGKSYKFLRKIRVLRISGQKNTNQFISATCLFNGASGCPWFMHYKECDSFQSIQIDRYKKSSRTLHIQEASFQPGFYLVKFQLYHNHYKQQNPVFFDFRSRQIQKKQQIADICEAMHDAYIRPRYMKTIMQFLTKRQLISSQVNYYNYIKNIRFPNCIPFPQWYKRAKQLQLEVYLYPKLQLQSNSIQHIQFYIPDFICITESQTKQMFKRKGQLVGIKILQNKIIDKTKDYQDYNIIFFYQNFPNKKQLVYMVGIYPSNNYVFKKIPKQKKVQKKTNNVKIQQQQQQQQQQINIQVDQQYFDDNQQQQNAYKKLRVDINMCKIIQIFLKTMGSSAKTLIIDNNIQVMQTIQYFVYSINHSQKYNRTYINKLNYAINPMNYIIKNIQQSLHQICLKLLTSYSQNQYNQIYQQQLKKTTNQHDYQGLKKFHGDPRKNQILNKNWQIFLGNWFNTKKYHLYFETYQIYHPMNLTGFLVMGCTILKKQFKQQKMRGPYIHNFSHIIQFIRIGVFYNETHGFLQQFRQSLYKQGFKSIMKQLYKAYQLSNITSYNHNNNDYNISHHNHNYNKQKQLKSTNQLKLPYSNGKNIHQLNLNYMHIKPYKLKTKNQQLYKCYENQVKINPNIKQQENQKKQQQNIGDYISNFDAEPFSKIYQRTVQKQKQQQQQKNKIQKQQQKINQYDEQNSSFSLSLNSLKPILHKQFPTNINIRMASYQQIYPIQPSTKIKNLNTIPYFFQFWQRNQIYTCKQQQLKNTNIIDPYFVCSCNYTISRGLPCRHIINICLKYRLNLNQYIRNYWRTYQTYGEWRDQYYSNKGLEIPSQGRPKASKRNRLNRNRF